MRSSLRMSTAPLSLEASPPAGRSSPAGLLGLGFLDVSPQEQQPAPAAPGALFARPSSDGAVGLRERRGDDRRLPCDAPRPRTLLISVARFRIFCMMALLRAPDLPRVPC